MCVCVCVATEFSAVAMPDQVSDIRIQVVIVSMLVPFKQRFYFYFFILPISVFTESVFSYLSLYCA